MTESFDKTILNQLLPSKIESLKDLNWIPRDRNPIGLSNCYLCMMCGMMMVSRYSTLLINDPDVEVKERFMMTVNSGEVTQFDTDKEEWCVFCKDINN